MSDGEPLVDTFDRILSGGTIVFAGNVVGAVAAFSTRLIAARYLGPSEYGLLVLGITTLGLTSIVLTFGFSKGLPRQLTQTEEKAELFQSALLISIPMGALVALAFGAFAPSIAGVLSVPSFSSVLVPFAVALPLYLIGRLSTACMQGFGDSRAPVVLRSLSFQSVIAVLVGVGAIIGVGVVQMALVWPIAAAFSTVVSLYYVGAKTDVLSTTATTLPVGTTRALLSFSIPLLIADIGYELMIQMDNVFLGYFHTSQSVGVYDASFMLATPLLVLIESFGFMLLPIFSELHEEEEREQQRRIYKLTTKWMALLALPVYLVGILFSTPILHLVYGGEYTESSIALTILLTGTFIPVVLGLNQQAHIAFGRTRTILKGNVLALLLNTVANVVLIPPLGIEGAALASALAFGLLFVYWGYVLYVKEGIQPFYRGMVTPLASSCVLFFVVFFATGALPTYVHLGATVLLYGIAHGGILLTIAMEDEDRALVRKYVDRSPFGSLI